MMKRLRKYNPNIISIKTGFEINMDKGENDKNNRSLSISVIYK